MAAIDTNALSSQYALDTNSTTSNAKELGQGEFLELMLAQLENQDPMEPMDNGEFLGQMAQFSTVTGIEKMQESIEQLTTTYSAGQTLQSAQLVGHEVLIEGSAMELSDIGSTEGSFEMDNSSGDVLLNISDNTGSVIRQVQMGEFPAGRHSFSWDGLDDNGNRMTAGTYSAQVSMQQGEEFEDATVLTLRTIESVEFGSNGNTILNTPQGDTLTLADIRQIRQSNNTNSETQQ